MFGKILLENNVLELKLIEIYLTGQFLKLHYFGTDIYWESFIFSRYRHFTKLQYLE